MQQADDRQAQVDPGEGSAASESGEVGTLASLLKDSSEFGPLTGVYARGMFNSLIRTALEGKPSDGKSPMLLQVGLDASTLDEPVSDDDADERIVRLANVLARQFGPQGVAVCRLSHELFAVVLSSSDDRLAQSTIESVQKELGTIQPTMSISFGAARFGGAVKSAHELVVAATKALQVNRLRGKNGVAASKAA
ncbi:diguanylate cyclase domain-containing protein [Limnofasciculus baicalensis]|uniref:Diguanylate cyclase n=1 Tax=Limnofasciculus baicalensis BBK-W-15 TaxID=2699891 RepID=A0AAE3KQK7_9CYAN|nr:diguanylate cyclase [Limnofasciculus baicalensis]MCP2732569.1 diguanylate cyclase [Limnofasciculus baicalensis BBK-W-15]